MDSSSAIGVGGLVLAAAAGVGSAIYLRRPHKNSLTLSGSYDPDTNKVSLVFLNESKKRERIVGPSKLLQNTQFPLPEGFVDGKIPMLRGNSTRQFQLNVGEKNDYIVLVPGEVKTFEYSVIPPVEQLDFTKPFILQTKDETHNLNITQKIQTPPKAVASAPVSYNLADTLPPDPPTPPPTPHPMPPPPPAATLDELLPPTSTEPMSPPLAEAVEGPTPPPLISEPDKEYQQWLDECNKEPAKPIGDAVEYEFTLSEPMTVTDDKNPFTVKGIIGELIEEKKYGPLSIFVVKYRRLYGTSIVLDRWDDRTGTIYLNPSNLLGWAPVSQKEK